MRIGIDVRYLSHGLVGGIHTFLLSVLPPLFAQAETHHFVLYADTKCPFELSDLPANVKIRYLTYRTPLSSVYNDWTLRRIMAHDEIDVAHFPANYGFGPKTSRVVITVHDHLTLLPLSLRAGLGELLRGKRGPLLRHYLHFCSVQSLRHAALVLTISEYSRREIAHHGNLDPARIVPIPHGAPRDLTRVTDPQALDQVRAKFGLTRPFVLADAIKNPRVLTRAWKMLPKPMRSSNQMVFFSRTSKLNPALEQAVANGSARVLLRPTRAELAALYSMAVAFIFPTWVEGFGLPILEAMACGAPVIASDRGSITEVAGDAAWLVGAEDAKMLAAKLEQLLESPSQIDVLRQMGYARVREFSWDRSAAQILECYGCVIKS
jgi:glycosyltransferase involved in cell wall biosynthesis